MSFFTPLLYSIAVLISYMYITIDATLFKRLILVLIPIHEAPYRKEIGLVSAEIPEAEIIGILLFLKLHM